ncbi:efflux RND transporter periplasmic adaptor subunit [Amorphus sp. MBR-141]
MRLGRPHRNGARRRLGRTCAVVASVALLSACGPEEAAAPRAPERVVVQVVSYQPVSRTISLVGTVTARFESNLSFRTAGRIAERDAGVGDHVKKGDVLARLETKEQQADLDIARATLKAAEATLAQAQSSFSRQQTLMKKGFTTRSSLDEAQERLRVAEGSVESAKADIGTAENELSFTTLKADADGVITARDAEVGQVVSAAQAVFTLAPDGDRDAAFDVYEALVTQPPPEGPIEIRLQSDPEVKATATVREVSPTLDPDTGTIRVKMSLTDPPAAMGLGVAVIGTGHWPPQQLVSLPWTALTSSGGAPAVWVVDPQTARVSERQVVVERYRTGEVLLSGGLNSGETVVIRGGQFLREGQTVLTEPEASS